MFFLNFPLFSKYFPKFSPKFSNYSSIFIRISSNFPQKFLRISLIFRTFSDSLSLFLYSPYTSLPLTDINTCLLLCVCIRERFCPLVRNVFLCRCALTVPQLHKHIETLVVLVTLRPPQSDHSECGPG